MKQVSVAICTYRRAELLPKTLKSLLKVKPPAAKWELIIVDNDCDEQVHAIAERFEQPFRDRFGEDFQLRYTQQPEVGIAHARNRAVETARAPVILFADDDVLFHTNWLCAMVDAIINHPECSIWGGRIVPQWEVDRPAWFDLQRCPMLGDTIVRYDAGNRSRVWDPSRDLPFFTCNLALRVDAIRSAGMFDTELGHKGNRRGGGEDTRMVLAIANAEGLGRYVADAVVNHPVPATRLTRSYARSFAWRQGALSVHLLRLDNATDAIPNGRLPRWVYPVAAKQMLAGLRQWATGMCQANSGGAFAGQFTLLFGLSKLCHALTAPRDTGSQ